MKARNTDVVLVCCGDLSTDEHHKVIKYVTQNPGLEIEVVPWRMDNADDLSRFLDTRNKNEDVYFASAFSCAACVLDAAEKGLNFGFFETGSDGRLKFYWVEHYCHLKLIYQSQPKTMVAAPGSEYHLP